MRPATDILTDLFDIHRTLAFDVDAQGRVFAGHDASGSMQLVEIDRDGVMRRLTDLPGACSGRYRPGTRTVIVQHDNGGDEQMQFSTLEADRIQNPCRLDDLEPLVHDARFMHVLRDVTHDAVVYSTTRRNGVDMDLVRHDLATSEETVLHEGGGYTTAAVVSHDGSSVVTTALSLLAHSTVIRVDGPRAVGEGAVTDAAESAMHHEVAWARNDEALIVTSNRGREFTAVFRVSVDGQHWEVLAEHPEHDVVGTPDPTGQHMVVATRVDGALDLAVHDTRGRHRFDIDLGEPGMRQVVWAGDGSHVLVATNAPTDPGSLWRVDVATGAVVCVHDGRRDVPERTAGVLDGPSRHRIPTADGHEIPCFRYEPSQAVPELAGAAVIHIHGGPESSADQVFSPVIQALRAAGFTVLVPNVRGSTGYGRTWYSLDDGPRRLDSVGDLAAIHRWLPKAGLDRAALWGGSYGGYMVLAGVSMQPDLWAAGVDIVGMSSLVTFLENTSAYRRAYREREYGSLDHDRAMLEAASPLTYLNDIRAPLFVIHGANDPRVPLSEAQQIKGALDSREVACKLRVYPDEGHGLAKRANRVDAYPEAIAFLTRHLGR